MHEALSEAWAVLPRFPATAFRIQLVAGDLALAEGEPERAARVAMKQLRVFLAGPWRAVAVLGVTQILAWGTMFYTPVLMLPRLAADRGFTATFAMAGFSAGLLVAGFVARYVGILIDGYGGHRVMPAGSLLGALGLVGLTYAADPLAYFAVTLGASPQSLSSP